MNRRKNELIQIEVGILSAAMLLRRRGTQEFHGFLIAKTMEDDSGARSLVGHGTLYKALGRLEELGYLRSRWEGSEATNRYGPRRRLYEITAEGQQALAAAPTRRGVRRLTTRPATS